MIAHRPGFTAPTVAARQLATLDHLTNGRAGVHIITGGNDQELKQDGDFLTKDERYARTSEYLDVVKASWTSTEPFDYAGQYYRFERAFSNVKPIQKPHLPVYSAVRRTQPSRSLASTLTSMPSGVRRTPKFGIPSRACVLLRRGMAVSSMCASASRSGRSWPRRKTVPGPGRRGFSRAIKAVRAAKGLSAAAPPPNEGARRLLAAAAQGDRLDKRLYTGIAALTGAQGNSTALVGTADQVADALLDYYDLGVTTFLIRGFDPLEDAVQYGRDLIPAFRRLLTRRSSQRAIAAA